MPEGQIPERSRSTEQPSSLEMQMILQNIKDWGTAERFNDQECQALKAIMKILNDHADRNTFPDLPKNHPLYGVKIYIEKHHDRTWSNRSDDTAVYLELSRLRDRI